MAALWSTGLDVSSDKHFRMAQRNEASILGDYSWSTGHTDEPEYIVRLMNNRLGLSRASLHDTSLQTQQLFVLETL